MNKRLDKLKEILFNSKLDAIALVPGANFRFITGGNFAMMERPTVIFISKNTLPLAILPTLEVESFQKLNFDAEIIEWQDSDGYQAAFEKAKQKLGNIKKIGLEGQRIRFFETLAIKESFKDTELVDAHKIIMRSRIAKDENEIESIQQAINISELSLNKCINQINLGISETEIKNLLIQEMYKNGAEDMPFSPLVLISHNSSLPHGHSQHKNKLKHQDALLIDFGCSVNGYNSDITRTYFFNDVKKEHEKIYNAVLKANEIGLEILKPGITMHEIDDRVLNSLANSGYEKLIVHKTGHGLGLDVHENPYIMRKNYEKLESGMVLTIEPGLYNYGELGVRIEDDVLITDKGYNCLTSLPKDIQII